MRHHFANVTILYIALIYRPFRCTIIKKNTFNTCTDVHFFVYKKNQSHKLLYFFRNWIAKLVKLLKMMAKSDKIQRFGQFCYNFMKYDIFFNSIPEKIKQPMTLIFFWHNKKWTSVYVLNVLFLMIVQQKDLKIKFYKWCKMMPQQTLYTVNNGKCALLPISLGIVSGII